MVCIEHRTSNIEHRTSNIEHPASNPISLSLKIAPAFLGYWPSLAIKIAPAFSGYWPSLAIKIAPKLSGYRPSLVIKKAPATRGGSLRPMAGALGGKHREFPFLRTQNTRELNEK